VLNQKVSWWILAAVVVTLLLVMLIVSLLVLLSTPVAYWLGRATEIGALIKQKLQTMTQPLALLEEVQKALNVIGAGGKPALKVEQQSATVVTTIFSILTPAMSQFILFIGALVFYLVYQERLRSTVVYFLRERETRLSTLRTLSDIDESMTTYFGTFTIVNFCLGLVTVALTWLVGLPNPLLWGVLAGVLNYIPYIGPAMVFGTLGVVGLLTYNTLSEAAVAPLIFLVIVTIEGQFLTPTLMGRRLELNPFAVVSSVAAFGIGGFLGYLFYIKRTADPKKISDNVVSKALWRFLYNRWYLNSLLYWIGVVIPLAAYRRIYKYFENILMYGINPSVQQSMVLMSKVAKAVQTGNVQTYLYVFSAGIILITMLLLS